MEKFLLNVLQLIILIRVSYSLIRWMLYSKKRSRKSIANKVWGLFDNRIHHHLDNALKNQKKKFKEKTVVYPPNVVPLRKTK